MCVLQPLPQSRRLSSREVVRPNLQRGERGRTAERSLRDPTARLKTVRHTVYVYVLIKRMIPHPLYHHQNHQESLLLIHTHVCWLIPLQTEYIPFRNSAFWETLTLMPIVRIKDQYYMRAIQALQNDQVTTIKEIFKTLIIIKIFHSLIVLSRNNDTQWSTLVDTLSHIVY